MDSISFKDNYTLGGDPQVIDWTSLIDIILSLLLVFILMAAFFKIRESELIKPGILTLAELKDENIELNSRLEALNQRLDIEALNLLRKDKTIDQLKEDKEAMAAALREKDRVVSRQKDLIESLRKELVRFKEDRQLIIWKESDGISFEPGSADITPFKKILNSKIKAIDNRLEDLRKYNVNTIEIVGHTDGVAVNKKGNLDSELEKVLLGDGEVGALHCGSNADLGLTRALSIALFLRGRIERKDIIFKVYSAAQLILPNGRMIAKIDRKPDPDRRRIEIRFTNTPID